MAKDVNLNFRLLGKDVSASKVLKDVGNESEHTGGKFSKLGGVMAGIAGVAAGVAVAGVAIGGALMEAAKAAQEDQKSSALLDRTLRVVTRATKDQTASVEDWIDKTQRAKGVADDVLRPALAQLVRSTGDVTKAQKLLSLALDISAGTGKDLQTVSVALSKAYSGNTAGLGRLGISMKDAKGHALTFDAAVAKLSKQFSGQAAAAANTYDGKMKRLDIAFSELKESIGYKVLPIVEKFTDWMIKVGVPWLQKTSDEISKWLVPALKSASDSFDSMGKTVKDNQQFFDDFSKVALPLAKSGLTQFSFTLGLASQAFRAFGAVGSWVESGLNGWGQAASRVTQAFRTMAYNIGQIIQAIRNVWNNTIGGKGLHLPSIGGFGGADLTIPRLASGGIVTSPTLALIGEAGPEAVVPLSGRSAGIGGVHIYVTQPLGTPQQIGRAVRDAMRQAGTGGYAAAR